MSHATTSTPGKMKDPNANKYIIVPPPFMVDNVVKRNNLNM